MTRAWAVGAAVFLAACEGTPPVGGDGGGGGGGANGDCVGGCAEWQTCRPAASGGVCETLTVVIEQPADGVSVDAGASVSMVARVTEWDGGLWSGASLPASANGGATAPAALQRNAQGVYAGVFTMPAVGGTSTLTAGWAAAQDSVMVDTVLCTAARRTQCQGWEECVPTKTDGMCVERPLTLAFEMPTEDAGYRANSLIPVLVRVTVDAGAEYPLQVPVTHSGMGTQESLGRTATPGLYEGTISSEGTEGHFILTAGWTQRAATLASRGIFVDATAPRLGLVPSVDGGYQRDSIVTAVLTANEPLGDAGLWLGGVEMPRLPMSNCAPVADAGACFELDFSKPALNALSGNFAVEYTATDLFEHPTARLDGGRLAVTRIRWATCPAGCGGNTDITALATDPDGGLYVGVTRDQAPGAIHLVSAVNGQSLTGWDAGSVQSLSANADLIYFAMNDAIRGGQIGALGSESAVTVGAFAGASTSRTYSGLALVKDATRGVGAIGSINSLTNGNAVVYFPTEVAVTWGTSFTYDAFAAGTGTIPSAAVNVVISKSASASPLASFLRKPLAVGANWQPVSDFFVTPLAGTSRPLTSAAVIPPVGQALLPDGGVLITTTSAGGDSVFVGRWDGASAGGTAVESGNLGGASSTGVPVVRDGSEAYAGRAGGLYRFNPSNLAASTAIIDDGGTDAFLLSPVLTKSADGGLGLGYALSGEGNLVAFGLGDAGVEWLASLGAAAISHPTMDCNRASPRSRTGVIYVGLRGGAVKAVLVDSPALLDTPGAWPKYQRSMGNAGNDDLANFPTNWPGCP